MKKNLIEILDRHFLNKNQKYFFETFDFLESRNNKKYLSFIQSEKYLNEFNDGKFGKNLSILLVKMDILDFIKVNDEILLIPSENPREDFYKLLKYYFHKLEPIRNKLDFGSNVSIESSARISGNVRIGNNVYIGENVLIRGNVVIGNDVRILHNTIIGEWGFEMAMIDNKVDTNIPHLGSVYIGSGVNIGCFCKIDSSIFSKPTLIGNNVNMDAYVNVAHNVEIGDNCVITAMSGLAGGVVLEPNCTIGSGVIINNKVRIKEGSRVGIGSIVLKSNKKKGTLFGSPAKLLP